jgi:hypothetical protein
MMGPISNLPEHPFQLIFDKICIQIIELSCVIEKKKNTNCQASRSKFCDYVIILAIRS